MPIVQKAPEGDTEAYILECVKFVSHLAIISKKEKLDSEAVISGRAGAVMWATAVETAAVGEEGGVPMSVEKFKQQIKGIWENERRFEDTPISVVIRGCEELDQNRRNGVLEAIFGRSEPPYHFGRTPFSVHLRREYDINDPSSRLLLPRRFNTFLHDSALLVMDPPIVLARLAIDLSKGFDENRDLYRGALSQQVAPIGKDPIRAVRLAKSIRHFHDHAFHASSDYEALVILFYLYKLMEPSAQRGQQVNWRQAPFGSKQGREAIENSMQASVKVRISEWMKRVEEETLDTLERFHGLEKGQRSHEPMYQENLHALQYFNSFFAPTDRPKVIWDYSISNTIHYPSYPRNPHEAATRSKSPSHYDIASLLQ